MRVPFSAPLICICEEAGFGNIVMRLFANSMRLFCSSSNAKGATSNFLLLYNRYSPGTIVIAKLLLEVVKLSPENNSYQVPAS